LEKRKILLADDSKLFLEMERTVLNRDSFELHTARTGREALDSSIKVQPHLILLSFTLPDMPGDEICSAVKKDLGFSNTKVVIVTDEFAEETLTRCVDAGCDGIVTRPIDKEKLLETVQKLLGETFRRKPRYRVQLQCAVYLEREGVPATMLDISEIGCRIAAEDSLEVGTSIGVGFSLPDTEQTVNWNGTVRWSVPHRGDETHSVCGVEFMDTPGSELEILQDILASMPASSRL
jgi:CheY-like chemotaxis protein